MALFTGRRTRKKLRSQEIQNVMRILKAHTVWFSPTVTRQPPYNYLFIQLNRTNVCHTLCSLVFLQDPSFPIGESLEIPPLLIQHISNSAGDLINQHIFTCILDMMWLGAGRESTFQTTMQQDAPPPKKWLFSLAAITAAISVAFRGCSQPSGSILPNPWWAMLHDIPKDVRAECRRELKRVLSGQEERLNPSSSTLSLTHSEV